MCISGGSSKFLPNFPSLSSFSFSETTDWRDPVVAYATELSTGDQPVLTSRSGRSISNFCSRCIAKVRATNAGRFLQAADTYLALTRASFTQQVSRLPNRYPSVIFICANRLGVFRSGRIKNSSSKLGFVASYTVYGSFDKHRQVVIFRFI